VALVLDPLADAELVLGGAEQTRLLLSVLMALCRCQRCRMRRMKELTHIVEDEKNFALL
jgi:hypothetical protein